MKQFKNKKGVVEFLLDIWAYILFAVAIAVFLVIFKFQSITQVRNELTGMASVPSSSSTLAGYLRTPIDIDGKKTDIANLIRLWYFNPVYKDLLEKTTTDLLNRLEYEYADPQTKHTFVRGFQLSINSRKKDSNTIDPMLSFSSKSFDSSNCASNFYGCVNSGEQFIPVSETATLYIVLRESQKPK